MSQQLPRLFLPTEQFDHIKGIGDLVTGSQNDYHYLFKVLRLELGGEVILLNGKGQGWHGKIASYDQQKVQFEIIHEINEMSESPVQILLAQSLIKKDNFEFVLQKGTELGVTEFYPLITDRTEVKIDKSKLKLEKKMVRWQEIVKNAAQQCRRQVLPKVHYPIQFDTLLSNASDMALDFSVLGHEDMEKPLKQFFSNLSLRERRGIILIGPEGGFSDLEVEKALEMGVIPVSMGPRILRTETAGIVAVSIIQYEIGDIGNSGGNYHA